MSTAALSKTGIATLDAALLYESCAADFRNARDDSHRFNAAVRLVQTAIGYDLAQRWIANDLKAHDVRSDSVRLTCPENDELQLPAAVFQVVDGGGTNSANLTMYVGGTCFDVSLVTLVVARKYYAREKYKTAIRTCVDRITAVDLAAADADQQLAAIDLAWAQPNERTELEALRDKRLKVAIQAQNLREQVARARADLAGIDLVPLQAAYVAVCEFAAASARLTVIEWEGHQEVVTFAASNMLQFEILRDGQSLSLALPEEANARIYTLVGTRESLAATTEVEKHNVPIKSVVFTGPYEHNAEGIITPPLRRPLSVLVLTEAERRQWQTVWGHWEAHRESVDPLIQAYAQAVAKLEGD